DRARAAARLDGATDEHAREDDRAEDGRRHDDAREGARGASGPAPPGGRRAGPDRFTPEEGLEVARDGVAVPVALLRVLGERDAHDRVERPRDGAAEAPRGGRGAAVIAFPLEGAPERERLEEDGAEREDVARRRGARR